MDMQEQPVAATFIKPESLTGTFGVVRLWPGVKNAEVEVIARLKRAAQILGLSCVEISPEGERVDSPGVKVTQEELDFVIHLHFETPKTYDIFSFVALWNPLRYYYEYREGEYRRFSQNLLSHDDFLSCDSPGADDHVRRMIGNDPCRLPPSFTIFHSLAEPILPPSLGDMKLFYVGINWERLRGEKSRNQELLDLLDKSGRLRIYGPHRFLGVDVWSGYKSYVGEIPFDGVSIVKEIAAAGISLVLSSEAHKESGLMSNRLFESLAAGAIIICDENTFARKHFGDTLFYIDATDSAEITHQKIREHLRWIETHKEEAVKLARKAQAIFLKNFTLDRSLAQIYRQFPARKAALTKPYITTSSPPITLFLLAPTYDKKVLQRHIDSATTQSYPNLNCVFLVDSGVEKKFSKQILKQIQMSGLSFEIRPVNLCGRDKEGNIKGVNKLGNIIYEQLQTLANDSLCCFVNANEALFSDHIQTLVHALTTTPEASSAYANAAIRSEEKKTVEYRVQSEVAPFEPSPFAPFGMARFLIRKPADYEPLRTILPYLNEKALAPLVILTNPISSNRTTVLSAVESSPQKDANFENEIIQDFLPPTLLEKYTSLSLGKQSGSFIDPLCIEELPTAKRIAIVRALFMALPMPSFIRKLAFWFYRLLRKSA